MSIIAIISDFSFQIPTSGYTYYFYYLDFYHKYVTSALVSVMQKRKDFLPTTKGLIMFWEAYVKFSIGRLMRRF